MCEAICLVLPTVLSSFVLPLLWRSGVNAGATYAIATDSYILIFLKFIQSIIPNIEYDYTGEFKIVHK